jgi:hypothetical protein
MSHLAVARSQRHLSVVKITEVNSVEGSLSREIEMWEYVDNQVHSLIRKLFEAKLKRG